MRGVIRLSLVFILLSSGFVIWSLWGNEIGDFFGNLYQGITEDSESIPTQPTNNNSESTYAHPTESFIEELTISVYTLVNIERTQRGLNSLLYDSLLTSLAVEHSEEMILYDYFSHDRMAGSRDFD